MWILWTVLLLGLPPESGPAAQTPKDFAVRLRFGCGTLHDVIDTFRGEYSRDIGPQYPLQHTWLSFSRAQKSDLFRLVGDAQFFDYPLEFRPPGAQAVEPSSPYELTVRSERREHTVRWDDPGTRLGSPTVEATRLRKIIQRIIQFAQANPRVADLPQRTQLCL